VIGNRRSGAEDFSDRFIGRSKTVLDLLGLVARVARSDSTVLITGESGTGKERIARLLHEGSPRSKNPFVPVNCGAIPEGLIESELFGHEKGAFTGAINGRSGRFEMAEGGTIFFDEIGELPLSLQVKLLRVLQEKVYERVGGAKPKTANVRILAATHRNLEEMSRSGSFREDLFYRLSVIPVELPPLRKRPEDIPVLIEFFIRRWQEEGRGDPVRLTKPAMLSLTRYDWPGNVRELENVMERLLVLNGGEKVDTDGLPEKISRKTTFAEPFSSGKAEDLTSPFSVANGSGVEFQVENLLQKNFCLGSFLADLERNLVLHALEKAGRNRSRAAEILGINRTTLIEKIKRFGLNHTESSPFSGVGGAQDSVGTVSPVESES
jgi:sigma-54 specific flagellar transcriptional regulator A